MIEAAPTDQPRRRGHGPAPERFPYRGQLLSYAELAAVSPHGLREQTLYTRIKRKGWRLERAVNTPPMCGKNSQPREKKPAYVPVNDLIREVPRHRRSAKDIAVAKVEHRLCKGVRLKVSNIVQIKPRGPGAWFRAETNCGVRIVHCHSFTWTVSEEGR